ncbi:MAG: ABC transporter transmembrane domain-containing protein, partial [Bacteriovoracaceae bacterium]
MWKQITFSNVNKYISRGTDQLTFKKLEKFFESNEVTTACDKDLKKIHLKTSYNFKWTLLSFITLITVLKLIGPVIIHQLISELDLLIAQKKSWVGAASWSLILIACQILHTFVGQHYIYRVTIICQSISKKINKMIFSKVLSDSAPVSESEVINRSVQDSENASNILWIGTELALCLLTIVFSSICLLFYLGHSAILPLVLLFTIFPIGRMYANRFSRLQTVIQKHKDDRLESLSNFLGDMTAIKSLGWEGAVFNEIRRPRRIEQYFWNKLIKLRSQSTVSFLLINALVASMAFGLYIFNGGILTAELAFACLCYFGFLEPSLKQLSKMSNDLAGALTANKRIQLFLNNETKSQSLVSDPGLFESQSVAIVGNLGGGKSTLLNSLIHAYSGKTVGYQPQDPYIFEASLLENLTLGKSVCKKVINKALDLTFLNTDLTFSERGLRTRLKAGGGDLSFAQKQRIVLARTYCLNPEILLFDEPCSSFDSQRVDFIFNNLIFGEWKNKKKIIVTSQIRHLSKFDRIIFIDSSRCLHVGNYQELLLNHEFHKLVITDKQSGEDFIRESSPKYNFHDDENNDDDEEVSDNEVTPSLYLYYLKAMHAFKGRKRVVLTLSLLVLSALSVAFLPILQNVYITKWTGQSGSYHWALGYLGIGFILSLLAGTQNFIWSSNTFKAAANIHDSVLTSVLGRYITFFDLYPGSKLLNVFSKDLDTIEKDLTFHLEDAFMSSLHTVTSLLVLMITLPIVIFVLIPVSYFFTRIVSVYRRNLCRLKNLIAEARIPRIRSLSEVVEGRDVILAFNAQRFFQERLNRGLNYYQDAISFQTVFSRWFVIKVSCLGSVISLAVAAYVCYYSSLGVIGKGVASMMILYSFKFWENICWSV